MAKQINKVHEDGNRHTRRADVAKKRQRKGKDKKENIWYAHEHAFEIQQRVERKQNASHDRAIKRMKDGKNNKISVL